MKCKAVLQCSHLSFWLVLGNISHWALRSLVCKWPSSANQSPWNWLYGCPAALLCTLSSLLWWQVEGCCFLTLTIISPQTTVIPLCHSCLHLHPHSPNPSHQTAISKWSSSPALIFITSSEPDCTHQTHRERAVNHLSRARFSVEHLSQG